MRPLAYNYRQSSERLFSDVTWDACKDKLMSLIDYILNVIIMSNHPHFAQWSKQSTKGFSAKPFFYNREDSPKYRDVARHSVVVHIIVSRTDA